MPKSSSINLAGSQAVIVEQPSSNREKDGGGKKKGRVGSVFGKVRRPDRRRKKRKTRDIELEDGKLLYGVR